MSETPRPGSTDAKALGCRCSGPRNSYGRGIPGTEECGVARYDLDPNCIVHPPGWRAQPVLAPEPVIPPPPRAEPAALPARRARRRAGESAEVTARNERLRAMVAAGELSYPDIGRELGLSPSRVGQHARKLGFPSRKSNWRKPTPAAPSNNRGIEESNG